MGCLTVTVTPVPLHNLQVSADNGNDIHVTIGCRNTAVTVQKEARNVRPEVDVTNRNAKLMITAALICVTSAGDMYEYFYVTEGPLIVEDGYFKVRRFEV